MIFTSHAQNMNTTQAQTSRRIASDSTARPCKVSEVSRG